MALRDPNQTYTYKIFGRNITLPKGFQLAPGVSINQNKKSVEEGFRRLQKWLKNPTPENWNKIFGKNNSFGLQLRNYLLGRNDLGSVKGMPTANAVFDALNIKSLIKPTDIEKINNLTIGGKGVSLKSIAANTKGNLKFPMSKVIETIKDFQNGEAWLRANPDPNAVDADGKNIYRKFANAIRQMEKEATKIGGFPFGNNSEKKLWAGLYRSSYRGDRIKIVGEFADGNIPINKQGKVDWKMTNKAGVPAWKRVRFVDTALPGQPEFTWNNFKGQVDNVFGKGAFNKITAPYDVQIKTGSKRLTSGNYETIKNRTKVNLLRAELFAAKPGLPLGKKGINKVSQVPTEAEYNKYVNAKAQRFNITEVHHPDGIGKNPWKMEPVFRYANRELDKVSQKIKAGTISLDDAKLEIERINRDVGPIRMKLDDGYFGTKTTSQKATMQAAESYLNNFIKNVKGTKGACRILIGKAIGGNVDTCEAIIRKDPEAAAKKINQIPEQSGPINKVKNSATKFLTAIKENPNILKGRFGALAALGVGTVAAGVGAGALVKQFRSDDPSTYLTNESQMEGMLIEDVNQLGEGVEDNIFLDNQFKLELAGAAGLTAPIAGQVYRTARQGTPPLLESPLEFDKELKDLKRTIRQITHPGGKKAKKISEAGQQVIRSSKIRINQIQDIIQSAKAGKEGSGVFRSAFGLEKGVLGKGLWALGAPIIQAPATIGYIAQDVREGKDVGEIATNPLNYLGAAFMNPSVKALARAGASRGLLGIASLGLAGTALGAVALPAISIGAGLATLGTLGYQGYKLFTGKNREDEFRFD